MSEPVEPHISPRDQAGAVKKRLRAELLGRRRALSPAAYAERSRRICEHVLALPDVQAASTVHVYWPLLDRREVDTRGLIRALWGRGIRVVVPVVLQPRPPRLRHVALACEADLWPGQWGLLEPHGPDVDPASLDVVLVPALGVDGDGYRVGYGGGFYDAFLAGIAAPALALAFDDCVIARAPREAHDVPVRIVVTESGARRAAPRAD